MELQLDILKEMLKEGVRQEIAWGHYVIGNQIAGLTKEMITEYIQYLGNLRFTNLGFDPIYPDQTQEPDSMRWVSQYSNANMVKTDFFEAYFRFQEKMDFEKTMIIYIFLLKTRFQNNN